MSNLSMRPSPFQPSLHDNNSHIQDTQSNPPYTTSNNDLENSGLDSFEFGLQDLEGLSGFHDSSNQHHGSANAFDQSYMSNLNFENQGSVMYTHHGSNASLQHTTCNDTNFLRGIQGYAEVSGPNDGYNEKNRKETYVASRETISPDNKYHRSFSTVTRGSIPTSMQSPPPPQHSSTNSVPTTPSRQTRYSPFGKRFHDSEDAKHHRHLNTRFSRQPYIPPSQDFTIASIEAERERQVERIYNAMTSGDSARDNSGSIAMKRWVHAAHYPANLVEAYAHKVFDCLLAQAKEGFRGWHHNDYVVDDRKGEDEDRDVNCEERLDNIIRALEEEKTICEDVMNSACQIRMFVNAPRAYANRKYQNRVGNSKRGRTKDTPDSNQRPSKARKMSRQCRTQSATISNPTTTRQSSRPSPQLREPDLLQDGITPSTRHVTPHPSQGFLSPLQGSSMPAPHPFFAVPQANPKSPPSSVSTFPSTSQENIQMVRMNSMPPPNHSPFLSPPALSHATYSTPVTPLNANTSPAVPDWQSVHPFIESNSAQANQSTQPINNLALPQDWPWSDLNPPNLSDADGSANLFEQYPGIDDTLTNLAQSEDFKDQNLDFQTLWESQTGVQPFPFLGPSGDSMDP